MRRVAGLAAFLVAAVLFVSYSTQPRQVAYFVPPVSVPAAASTLAASTAAAAPTFVVPAGFEASSTLIASNAGDFGGYTIPIIGLSLLAAIVAILAGPVDETA